MRGNSSVKMCQICDTIGIHEGCSARKLLEYSKSDNIASLPHWQICVLGETILENN